MSDNPVWEASLYARATRRIVPLLFFGYIAAFLDRVNVGFAKLQMASDLHFSDTVYGFGAGIFFLSYCLAQFPSNLGLKRVGARAWLGGTMIIWSLISAATGLVKTPAMFFLLRILLGLAEGGFYPAALFFLTNWYPSRRRAAIIASFMMAIGVSGVIGSPLSGWIMRDLDGCLGHRGWQWLFFLEAIPAMAGGLLMLGFLSDSIRATSWLSPEEKTLLEERVEADRRPRGARSLGQTFRRGDIWYFVLINFTLTLGLYGVGFWFPQIIADAGVTEVFQVGWLGAIPYLVAMVAMLLLGHLSDRRGERRRHLASAVFAAGIGLVLIALYGRHTAVVIVGLSLANAGVLSANPIYWAWTTPMLEGDSAGLGIGLMCALGNLAGFVGPYMMGAIRDFTHGTAQGVAAMAGSLFLCGVLILLAPRERPA